MSSYTSIRVYECQKRINEFQKIKTAIHHNQYDETRFIIQTRHWYGWGTESCLCKKNSILEVGNDTMLALIDTAISVERKRINNAIEIEVEDRKRGENNKC